MAVAENIRWNLTSIYPSIDSDVYLADKTELVDASRVLLEHLETFDIDSSGQPKWLRKTLEQLGTLSNLSENLGSYVHALWSVDTSDEKAQREVDELEELSLSHKEAKIRFRGLLSSLSKQWEFLRENESLSSFQFYLDEQLFLASRQMSIEEENLTADLQRSGADAWERLHGRLSAQLSRPWDGGNKTVTELRSLANHPDRSIRRRAWEEEISAWKSAEIPLAAALNGVKGASVTLNKRRGWGSTLERSLFQNRLTRGALDAMLSVMVESLPLFRRYFRAKAGYLGLRQLSWYDLFAPVGSSDSVWSWDRVADFIPSMFDTLSLDMGDFARNAFKKQWIDATPRAGKVGGAYCTHMPLSGESRILCNFDGSFDSVSTVAHELGHAWHGEQMNGLLPLNREYPMTLAETASIFSETLVFHAATEQAPPSTQLSILDTFLMGSSQVIVDILCRFYFETALMKSRPKGELSPRELSEMMLYAQDRSYGDVLVKEERHPWMWAVKGHYYSSDLAFYNFPYAFGQLFSMSLFARFQQEGGSFASRYNRLLKLTGSHSAVDVAKSVGFDIESLDFWREGIRAINEVINRYENLSF